MPEPKEKEEELELSPLYGKNPAKTACTNCKKPTGKTIDLGRIWQWRCLKCGNILVAKFGNNCKKCGNTSFLQFKRMTEFDGSDTMVPLGLCDRCETTKQDEETAKELGAYSWKCNDCGSSGWYPTDSDMHASLEKQYGNKIKGIKLTKKNCPVCHAQKNKEKRKRRQKKGEY